MFSSMPQLFLSKRFHSLPVYSLMIMADKGLSFLVPLVFLFVYHSTVMYSKMEYVFSVAMMILPIADLGLRSYMFYFYKESSEHEKSIAALNETISLLVSFYALLCLASLFLGFAWIGWMILARMAFQLLNTYLNNHYRLIDLSSFCSIFSCGTLVFVAIVLLLQGQTAIQYGVQTYHILIFASTVLALLVLFPPKINRAVLGRVASLLLQSIKFSWPIILNVWTVTAVGNFAKIYIYHHFSTDDMAMFSFVQRLSYVIVLVHVAIQGYYAKKVYMGTEKEIMKIFTFYSLFIVTLSVLMAAANWVAVNYFSVKVSFDPMVSILIIMYSMFWCFSAFIEAIFGRMNKNIITFLINAIALAVYGLLVFFGNKSMLDFSAAMALSMFVGFALSVIFYLFYARRRLFYSNSAQSCQATSTA